MKLNWNFQRGGLRKNSLPWGRYGYFLAVHNVLLGQGAPKPLPSNCYYNQLLEEVFVIQVSRIIEVEVKVISRSWGRRSTLLCLETFSLFVWIFQQKNINFDWRLNYTNRFLDRDKYNCSYWTGQVNPWHDLTERQGKHWTSPCMYWSSMTYMHCTKVTQTETNRMSLITDKHYSGPIFSIYEHLPGRVSQTSCSL